jgi:hypothetical protein
MTFIIPTWCGLPAEGEARADPFLRLGTLVAGGLATAPYGTALSLQAPFLVYGRRIFMETCWLPGLDSGSIPALMAPMAAAVSPGCAIATHEFKGAASRVPAEATAFGLRRDHVLVEILAVCADPADKAAEERHRQWTRATREALHEAALPGGYPNLLVADDAERVAKSYGPNVERLMAAKRCYDPDNVFSSAIPLPTGRQSQNEQR